MPPGTPPMLFKEGHRYDGFDYAIAGKPIHVTDAVDVSLVAPRERKYEQAGAASAADLCINVEFEE